MKNETQYENNFVEPYHEQFLSKKWPISQHYIPETFSLECSKYLIDLPW